MRERTKKKDKQKRCLCCLAYEKIHTTPSCGVIKGIPVGDGPNPEHKPSPLACCNAGFGMLLTHTQLHNIFVRMYAYNGRGRCALSPSRPCRGVKRNSPPTNSSAVEPPVLSNSHKHGPSQERRLSCCRRQRPTWKAYRGAPSRPRGYRCCT